MHIAIIENVLRLAFASLLLGLVFLSCGSGMQSKEKVRADLTEYLSTKVGLDMKALDVDVTKVTFEDGKAHATVSFHQKNNPAIDSGMVMQYTLAPKGGHWVVTGRADSQGHGFSGSANDQSLPQGHPPLQQLPPGHPSVDKMQSSPAEPPSQGQAK